MTGSRSSRSSRDSGDFDDPGDSRDPRGSGEYEGMAGNDQASPGRAYAQRAWDQGALTFVDMRTPGRSSSHQSEYSSDESVEDNYGRDDFEGDEDEPLFSQQLEGMDEYARPSTPEYAPQSVPSAPRIEVSEYGQPSNRPRESSRFPEASADDTGQEEDQDWYGPRDAEFDNLPPGMYFGSTPFEHPSQNPSPSGGYAVRDSSAARLNVPEQEDSPFTREMMAMGWPRDTIPARQEHGGTPLSLRPAGRSSSEGSAQRISPRSRPNVSPHPLSSVQDSMIAQGSPSPPGSESGESSGSDDGSQDSGGSVAAQASPSVQEPATAPDQYQRGGYSGARYAGQHLDPHQRGTGHQKRARESSSSSSGSHLQPPRKQHGDQGPRVPQRVSQDQDIDTTLRGISGLEARGQAQPQGASRPYGDPDPYGRAGASEAEAEEIGRAYANQVLPAPRLPNPFAGMPQGAPPSYASGAGRGYDRPPQGEHSAQGAGRSQPYPAQPGGPYAPQYRPMQGAGPGAASSSTGGTWRGNPPQAQSQGESSGQGAGQLPPQQRGEPGDPFVNRYGPSVGVPQHQPPPGPYAGPMRGMAASEIWRYISGQEGDNEGVNWEGRLYRAVDATKKGLLWPPHQVAQLRVIVASYLSWEEVVDQGQPLPGERSYHACAAKACDLDDPKVWTRDHDAEVIRLSSPRLEDRQAALNRLQGEFGRSKDEIVGRCMLFARSSLRANLGNKPNTGLSRLRKRG